MLRSFAVLVGMLRLLRFAVAFDMGKIRKGAFGRQQGRHSPLLDAGIEEHSALTTESSPWRSEFSKCPVIGAKKEALVGMHMQIFDDLVAYNQQWSAYPAFEPEFTTLVYVFIWPSYGFQDERERSFYIEGMCNHPYIRLVQDAQMADFVFHLTVQQMQPGERSAYFMEQDALPPEDLVPTEKLICVDQADNANPWGFSKEGPGAWMKDRCSIIFKRSKVSKHYKTGKSLQFRKQVGNQPSEPTMYPIADIAVVPWVKWEDRDHPVVSTLRHTSYWNVARKKILGWVRDSLTKLGIPIEGPGAKVHLGEFTKTTHHEWDKGYNNLLQHSKILVTCNPTNWEGDQV